MIRQRIKIPSADWRVDILYDARPSNADDILDMLWDMGCARHHLYKAEDLMKSGIPNQGLTYSDKYNRHTLIVVGHSSSVGEFLSSIIHEVDHLTDHISQYFGIPFDSEENSYLIGDIAKTIYENAVLKVFDLFRRYT